MNETGLALTQPPPEPDHAASSRVLSVIVTVLYDLERVATSFRHYQDALAGQGLELEFVYVLDRKAHRARAALEALKAAGAPLQLIVLSRWDGEVAAIKSGVRHARGTIFMLLPADSQVEAADLAGLLRSLDEGCDMVIGARNLLEPSWIQRVQHGMSHGLIRILFGRAFNDLACRVRACRRQVLDEILGHASQHQFLALLAIERGFEVREVVLNTTGGAPPNSRRSAALRPGAALRFTLDALALCVVLNYVRQPFRFFGAIGLPIFALGVVYAGVLAFERIWLGVALADRPALILAVLLIVLGIQVIVLGLIGEIIIFASGRRLKDYTIDRIL